MDDKEFDNYIKGRLSESQSDKEADWNAMHQRLVDEQILPDEDADARFDEALKSQIHQVRAPYNSNHWDQLREKLLTERYLRKRLAVVKFTELAVLLLFLFTTITLVPFKTDLYAIQKYKPIIDDVTELVSTAADKYVKFYFGRNIDANTLIASVEHDNIKSANQTEEVNLSLESASAVSDSYVDDSELSRSLDILECSIAPLAIERRNINGLALHALDITLPQVGKEHTLTISAGASVNDITAPFVSKVGVSGQSYTDVGQHVSLTVGTKVGKHEYYTGLGYSDVKYGPSISDGFFDNFNGEEIPLSEIEDISYNFLNIPLGYRYHFMESNKWSMYASGGINLGLLTYANYDFRELSPQEKKLYSQMEPLGPNSGNRRIHNNLSNGLATGIFQGGAFARNFNVAASVGVGVIRKLSEKVGLHIEPSYTRSFSLDGIGALDEDINNFRLDVGLRLTL